MGMAAQAQERGAVDWVFLVDTSQSMRGVGGTKDIFGDVKAALHTFVREASDGDSVSLYTFDRGVQSHGLRDVRGTFDREELFGTIDELQADGNRTHLGAAIAKGLERSEALLQRGDRTRVRAIVLFTDGKEDVRGIADPVSIPSNVQRALKSSPLMFFVSLGEHEQQLDDFPNATVIKAQDAEAIKRVAHEIRAVVDPEPIPPPPLEIRVTPATLDFGEIQQGQASVERELTIFANQPTQVAVRLASTGGVSMTPRDRVAVAPNADAHVRVNLDVAADATPGPRMLTFRVGDDASASGTLTVAKPSVLLRAARWLAAALVVALLLWGARVWNDRRHHLEGELEIVQPRVAADAAYVGLPALRAKEVNLSAFVPAEVLAGNDARLFVRRENGAKAVWIAARNGTLRVNDVETPASPLYDADTIRIGDVTLRFNRIGHERPSLQEDPA